MQNKTPAEDIIGITPIEEMKCTLEEIMRCELLKDYIRRLKKSKKIKKI
jgi:hypothetical protein